MTPPVPLPDETDRTPHAGSADRPPAAARAAIVAFCWAVGFVALHVYWFLGGRVGFGDQADPLPGRPTSIGGWIFELVVWTMFAAGLIVPLALVRPWGTRIPRRLLMALMWIGAGVLLARGGAGLVDDAVRFSGLVHGGLTGLSNQEVLGSAHPSTYTKLSTVTIDAIFVSGGIIFVCAARLGRSTPSAAGRRTPEPAQSR